MAERLPLVMLGNGDIVELPAGDTVRVTNGAPAFAGFDIVLIAGQSNTHYGTGLDPAIDVSHPMVKELGFRAPDVERVILAEEPLDHITYQAGRIGFALAWARSYVANGLLETGREVLLVAAGVGNTGLGRNEWNPGDVHYAEAVRRANLAHALPGDNRFVALLWNQGERDVSDNTTPATYQGLLDTMIAGFRADLAGDNQALPFVLGDMVPYWLDRQANGAGIRSVIADTPNRLAYTGFADARVPDVIDKPDNTIDDIHYDAAGQRVLAERYWTAFEAARMQVGTTAAAADITSGIALHIPFGPGIADIGPDGMSISEQGGGVIVADPERGDVYEAVTTGSRLDLDPGFQIAPSFSFAFWVNANAGQDAFFRDFSFNGVANTPVLWWNQTVPTFSLSSQSVSAAGVGIVGRWVHLAGTYDVVSQTMIFYLDGAEVGQLTNVPEGLRTGPVSIIGRLDRPDRSVLGRYDDFRIYDRALAPEDVAALAAM